MRHGEVANDNFTLYGRLPGYGLSATGREQASATGEHLADTALTLIVSSNLDRTRQTAHEVATRNLAAPRIKLDDRITEAEWGEFVGMDMRDFDSRREYYLELQEQRYGGLESPADIVARMRECLADCAARYPEGTLLFVSHADPISFLLSALDGEPPLPSKLRNYPKKASLLHVDLKVGTWRQLFTPSGAQF